MTIRSPVFTSSVTRNRTRSPTLALPEESTSFVRSRTGVASSSFNTGFTTAAGVCEAGVVSRAKLDSVTIRRAPTSRSPFRIAVLHINNVETFLFFIAQDQDGRHATVDRR